MNAQKAFKARLNEALERKLQRRKQWTRFEPRYDEVFFKGVAELNRRSDAFLEELECVRMD